MRMEIIILYNLHSDTHSAEEYDERRRRRGRGK
jgi:hypothetical protein